MATRREIRVGQIRLANKAWLLNVFRARDDRT